MSRKPWRAAVLLLVAAATLGWGDRCSRGPQERVEMRMRGDALERTLTPSDPSDEGERAKALRGIYGAPSAEGSFRKPFRTSLPGDLGGAGALVRDVTAMGRVVTYRERLRGGDAPAELFDVLNSGLAQLRQMTDGWIRAELGDQRAAAALDAWIRERVLPDLRDIAFYGWLAESERIGWEEHEQRVIQFLVERGYFRSEDTARLQEPDDAWALALRNALSRAGLKPELELERKVAFLATGDAAYHSLVLHVLRSDAFRAWRASVATPGEKGSDPLAAENLAAFAARKRNQDNEGYEAVESVFEAYSNASLKDAQLLLGLALAGEVLVSSDSVELSLELPEPPIATNGAWNPATHRIEWKELPLRDTDGDRPPKIPAGLAAFPFAIWSEPADAFQTGRFGRVVLRGADLRSYNRWYAKLPAPDQEAWDAFVATLSPGADLVPRIEAFRFADEPAIPDEQGRIDASRADDILEILVKALTTE